MKDSKRIWVWVGVVVVVVAAVFAVVWRPASKQPAAPSGPAVVTAPKGELVPEFPQGLILDSNASIAGSYSVAYSTSTNQYTAQYDSSSTVTAMFNKYESYLSQNGWTVNGTLTTNPSFDVITASEGPAHVQIVISKKNKGSQVIITDVVK